MPPRAMMQYRGFLWKTRQRRSDDLAVAKTNVRLNRPSSHTRLLSRVIILDVLWGGLSPVAAFLLRDGAIQSPQALPTYCGVAFLASLLVFQWFQTSSPIARFYRSGTHWNSSKPVC